MLLTTAIILSEYCLIVSSSFIFKFSKSLLKFSNCCCLVEAGSLEHTESQSWNIFPSDTSPFGFERYQQFPRGLSDDHSFINNGLSLEILQHDDTFPTWAASIMVPVPSFPDGVANTNPNELSQQFNSRDNSQRDVEGGVVCIEPDPKDLDHAGQASNGRIHKDDEARMPPLGNANSQGGTSSRGCNEKKRKGPQLTEAEQAQKQKKRENDKKYRTARKMECEKLKDLEKKVSRCGGIDQIESELPRLCKKEVDFDRFQQLIGTELRPLQQMVSRYEGIDKMKFMLDKYKELETKNGGIEKLNADYNKLNQIKSILEINEEEFIVDKVKGMVDELHKLKGIDETKPAKNRIKKMELQWEKQKQMASQKEVESFQASPGSPLEKKGSQLLDLISDFDNVPDQRGINLNFFSTVSVIAPNMQYSDGLVRLGHQ
ncbi:hypothetical protein ES332_D05G094200v1 [Gossypium tomentosum]|uniref:Uncharacterized protein n=1 Tax=Gossypium tomentosum TaxID=34277 RepID=A0A5D2KW90_GOSTO|nr:hypothetical protein ES332_D05G094200v1 [Gossypium tomentosum]